jgi:hypothetical protein
MNVDFHLENDTSDIFIDWLNHFKKYSDTFRDRTNHCLSPNCFATKNLLEVVEDCKFSYYLNILLENCQKHISEPVKYFYVHMIDYCNGGDMLIHKHDHNEDYSFIFYLNDCDDGFTSLYLDSPLRVKPEKGKILIFSSDVYHSATFSKNKKILVGGLKIYNK